MSKKNYYDDFDDFDDYDFDFDWDIESDLNSHKSKDKVKWIITVIAFLLVIVMLITLCLQVFGKGKAQPSEWFSDSEEEEAVLVVEPQGSMTAINSNDTRAVLSDNSYTLTTDVNLDDSSLVF